eukprot:CAMPEP_0204314728 /NCGR_PEP_ID=MMETSP0469-20131031/4401_1 /ASSEMBLY_ACC=CAM_ASM_000384 /TAXON_ID=2969 /ORGANISM="Oxyrrhis marina" /LENGTH=252 /DNA_ID=CAMNT_0051295265 /DNA_START=6 /DNA_END=764 /DNA_ORIENTATION=-
MEVKSALLGCSLVATSLLLAGCGPKSCYWSCAGSECPSGFKSFDLEEVCTECIPANDFPTSPHGGAQCRPSQYTEAGSCDDAKSQPSCNSGDGTGETSEECCVSWSDTLVPKVCNLDRHFYRYVVTCDTTEPCEKLSRVFPIYRSSFLSLGGGCRAVEPKIPKLQPCQWCSGEEDAFDPSTMSDCWLPYYVNENLECFAYDSENVGWFSTNGSTHKGGEEIPLPAVCTSDTDCPGGTCQPGLPVSLCVKTVV